jgi:uncharacterized protein YbjT (DUF2867 family)
MSPAPGRQTLVTGATGYIGGRLVPELLDAGRRVRVLVRHPERVRDQSWVGQVEVCIGDASNEDDLARALSGVDVAYYLLHSMGEPKRATSFETVEANTARAFGRIAKLAGVQRIVYLGGLLPPDVPIDRLSPHLRSRALVGEILRASGVPTVELRAAVILGSGSASFEMLRYLTERLPAMVTPRWVDNRIQPIAIRDVLGYLVATATLPDDVNRAFDIGGPEVLTYRQMMQRYAAVAGLKHRAIVPVPVLSPQLSSHWVGLVTPVPRGIARPLVESLRHEVICSENDITALVPPPPDGLMGFDRAVEQALRRIRDHEVQTRWSDASTPGSPSDPLPSDPEWSGGSLYTDVRERVVHADPASLWRVIEGVGGDHGWYSFPLAWEVRGLLDRLVGGVGLRRGRRDPYRLRIGEPVDFWRVEALEPGQMLRLRAEMKLPGLAWLELSVRTDPTRFQQRALFWPRGLGGHLYWWSVAPFHGVVFGSMVRHIARAAEDLDAGPDRRVSPVPGPRHVA